jgi:hypothetical protein
MGSRTLGETLPVSIGTAVPMETIINDPRKLKTANVLYLNLRTIFRNYHGSFTGGADIDELADGFEYEVTALLELIVKHTRLTPFLYLASHKSLSSIFSLAKIKTKHTALQRKYIDHENITVTEFISNNKNLVNVFDTLIKGERKNALILTHHPLDLLSRYTFSGISLLESHTGNIKERNQWITKLTKNETYINIPFNELSIQIFGDRNILFESLGSNYIKVYNSIAVDNYWNAATTMEKVRYDIRNYKDQWAAVNLLNIIPKHLK